MGASRRTPPPLAGQIPFREETLASASDGVADTEARVLCPCCRSLTTIGLDPGSGPEQRYTEECPVCCRPWSVTLRYDSDGEARVELAREDL